MIHACIPETVDRYYQEVGRGGRDGSPCLSYLATAPSDLPVAEDLNAQAIITTGAGLERWRAMFQSHRPGRADFTQSIWIPACPTSRGLTAATGMCMFRVLNLMARAGLIRLHVPEPPGSRRRSREAWEAHARRRSTSSVATRSDISLSDGQTNDPGHFRAVLASSENRILAPVNGTALVQLRAALRGAVHQRGPGPL